MHGGAYLAVKTEETIAFRARIAGFVAALLLIAAVRRGGVWVARDLHGLSHRGRSSPMTASLEPPRQDGCPRSAGAWLANYGAMPLD